MNRFINIKQRFRDASRRKDRKGKPGKPKKLRQQADDAQQDSAPKTPAPLFKTVSPVAKAEGNTLLKAPAYSRNANDDGRSPEEINVTETADCSEETEGPNNAHSRGSEQLITTADYIQEIDRVESYQPSENAVPEELNEHDVSDEQAIREEAYIVSTGEEPDDYTAGPARLVVANDGLKPCVSLLLTYDFSAKIQAVLRAQRDFAKSKRLATRELEIALNLEMDLETEVAIHESRLAFSEGDEEAAEDVVKGLQEELSTLQAMAKESANARQATNARLESEARTLFEVQARSNAYLEDAFVSAQLLEPADEEPETEMEDLDLQTEYRKYREEQQREAGEEATVVALDTSSEHLKAAPLSPEEQALLGIKEAFWRSQHQLQSAQMAFDYREETRAREWLATFETAARGEEPVDASPEDFDARWVNRIQELTHELIEAEVAFAAAKADALTATVDVTEDDQASGFVDDVADGYCMSYEQEQVASVPQPQVSSWLDNIPDQASPTSNNEVDVDEWDTQTVGISDSVSLVAEGPDRRRIEKWRRICGL
ncbi:hypothetical protein LTR65_007270 [Meristemomyces frigidus]